MKTEPKIIFSLSAFPLINNRWYMGNRLKETIYMTALSVLYCHLWYDDIELYVDETAYKLLYMLPCRVTQIEIEPDRDIWMKSKIHCIQRQSRPFVHLDTDVFIKKKINFNFDDILLERKEGGYHIHYKKQVEFFNQYTRRVEHWHPDLGHTFSCGVLGFKNLVLRDRFVKAFYELERIYTENRKDFAELKQRGNEPCILIEQYNLATLLHYLQVQPTLLLKGNNLKEHARHAEKIGFSHLFGIKKYKREIIQEIEYRLYKIFPYWYAQVKLALEKNKIIPKTIREDANPAAWRSALTVPKHLHHETNKEKET